MLLTATLNRNDLLNCSQREEICQKHRKYMKAWQGTSHKERATRWTLDWVRVRENKNEKKDAACQRKKKRK